MDFGFADAATAQNDESETIDGLRDRVLNFQAT
jgi:hypothetical protein